MRARRKLHLPRISLSLSFSAFFSSLTLSLHHTWKCGKGSQLWCAFPHASWEITAFFFFFSKASQAEESCMTMCLWVIFIVSVAAHWAERGKRYHCNLKGSIAKDQLRWRREPRLNHCYSLMLVLKQHAIILVRNEEIKQRRQSAVSSLLPEGWVGDTPDIYNKMYILSKLMWGMWGTNNGHPLSGDDECLQNGICFWRHQCSSHSAPALKDISAE